MGLFSKRDIIRRRINYVKYVVANNPIYDPYERAVLEGNICARDRGLSNNSLKMRDLRKDIANGRRIISRICISVTNQCSLRCTNCNNLMPYCKERYFADSEDIISDMRILLDSLDRIVNVEVIGGEPFLHKDLYRLIDYLCEQEKIDWIEITTNATILPKDDQWASLRNEKIIIKCSDYGEVNHDKIVRFFRSAKQHGVRCISLKNHLWYKPGGTDKRKRSILHQKYNYYHCNARMDCKTLYKGKLYMCGRAPILDELGIAGIRGDSVEVRNSGNNVSVWDEIEKLYARTNAECCNYCDCSDDDVEIVKSGVQLKREV